MTFKGLFQAKVLYDSDLYEGLQEGETYRAGLFLPPSGLCSEHAFIIRWYFQCY